MLYRETLHAVRSPGSLEWPEWQSIVTQSARLIYVSAWALAFVQTPCFGILSISQSFALLNLATKEFFTQ